ncbi:Growth regulation protein [Spathaspora sp. JA1]|nr:Growth regulation protein [Spathaspora sp. JA1]
MSHDIITQVTPESNFGSAALVPNYDGDTETENIDYNSKIHLNIRGKEFTITRDELMSLPESILLCLFPNGVFLDVNGQVITNLTEEDVVYVNFDPGCFKYIMEVFSQAQRDLEDGYNVLSPQSSYVNTNKLNQPENVLQSKPAIIVLREDLDFYVIPPMKNLNGEQIKALKLGVSIQLLKNKLIFSGLGYKFDQEQPQDGSTDDHGFGPAEQHLFDMLCSSGFDTFGKWGSRSLELNKCVISSLSLVRLKTSHNSETQSPALSPVNSNSNSPRSGTPRSRSRIAQLATNASRAASRSLSSKRKPVDSNQTKLLLFWRKPARKCWWSHSWIDIDIDAVELFDKSIVNKGKIKVKVHIRRVWTLELSVIGVQ